MILMHEIACYQQHMPARRPHATWRHPGVGVDSCGLATRPRHAGARVGLCGSTTWPCMPCCICAGPAPRQPVILVGKITPFFEILKRIKFIKIKINYRKI